MAQLKGLLRRGIGSKWTFILALPVVVIALGYVGYAAQARRQEQWVKCAVVREARDEERDQFDQYVRDAVQTGSDEKRAKLRVKVDEAHKKVLALEARLPECREDD